MREVDYERRLACHRCRYRDVKGGLNLFAQDGGKLRFRLADQDGFNGFRFQKSLKAGDELLWSKAR